MIYHHVYKFWLLSLLDEHGNFKEASNAARITQSALSQNLSALEAVLNKSLVVRERGSVVLTRDGVQIMRKVRPILESLDFIDIEASDKKVLKGNIRLGAYESIAVEYLPKLIRKINALHPELTLDVYTSRTEELLKLVRKGSLDMALVINGQSENKLDADVLFEDELGMYISKSAAKYGDDIKYYQSIGLATLSASASGHPDFYKSIAKEFPAELKVSVTCDSFETIRNFALTGTLIGLLPTKVAERDEGLVRVWPKDDRISAMSRHYVTLVSRKNISPDFTELVKEEMQTKSVD